MSKVVISLKNISKVFETETIQTHALRGVDLDINQGDYISISGPSGCGKSTLLSILGLLDTPSGGDYLLENQDVTKISADQAAEVRNKQIGFVFQSFNLIDELTVFDNIALPLFYSAEKYNNEDITNRVNECLEVVGIEHRAEHYPNQLSGGQQQKVSIARALVARPSIMLVDEPTGNLDSKSSELVMDKLAELNENGTTICLVTHDPVYAQMAKRQLHIVDGKIENVNSSSGGICSD